MCFSLPFKRLGLLVATALCLFITAHAQEFYYEGICYRMTSENTVEVTQDYYYGGYSGDITIPSQIKTEVYEGSGVELIEVDATVTAIGDNAFSGCLVTSIDIPSTIQSIGDYAFYDCTVLKGINLPNGLKSIGEYAFASSGIDSIVIPSGVTNIGWAAFYSCESLTTASIPEGIEELNGTFKFCTALKTVNLPNTLLYLDETFRGCSQLEEIDIPSSVMEVGENTFYNCNKLSNITCRPVTPPSAYVSSFYSSNDNHIYNNAILQVPGASLNQYSTADVWSNFVNIFAIGEVVSRGDADGDGRVTIADVTALIDYILSHDATDFNLTAADVDKDGIVGIADATCLIDYLLYGNWGDEPVIPDDPQDDGHEWVDLGLPSGTLWATCNVGASAPEEYGDYFAWGETEPKDVYDWSTYKWCNGSYKSLTKYCTSSYYGTIDNNLILEPEDDAAHMNWGEKWRMPSRGQQTELWTQCTCEWTRFNGVYGTLVTGSNGNTLFLPAAGSRSGSSLNGAGSCGYYWSRSLDIYNYSPSAYYLYYSYWGFEGYETGRNYGQTVRAVRVSRN